MENWNSLQHAGFTPRFPMVKKPQTVIVVGNVKTRGIVGVLFEEKFGKYITKPTTDLIVEQPRLLQVDINPTNVCNPKMPNVW